MQNNFKNFKNYFDRNFHFLLERHLQVICLSLKTSFSPTLTCHHLQVLLLSNLQQKMGRRWVTSFYTFLFFFLSQLSALNTLQPLTWYEVGVKIKIDFASITFISVIFSAKYFTNCILSFWSEEVLDKSGWNILQHKVGGL